MDPTFYIGTILIAGYILGMVAQRMNLPRIVGYIIAGILLNPTTLDILPADFIAKSIVANNIALAFITFCIGGSLLASRLKALGKSILSITFFEAEFTFVILAFGLVFFVPGLNLAQKLPLALLIAAVGSPTDPTPALAIVKQYKADGNMTRTILGVSASDDALGIMNFSLAMALAGAIVMGRSYFTFNNTVLLPLAVICLSVLMGVMFGIILTFLSRNLKSDESMVTIALGFVFICFGASLFLNFDELLSTMVMGFVFVNLSPKSKTVFSLFEKHFEELVFIVFFVLAGANLDFTTLSQVWPVILAFIVLRTIGKFTGAFAGAKISGASKMATKYTGFGLVPLGGIVVGMALLAKQVPQFDSFGTILINVTLGAVVVHELLGPIFVKYALVRAGEIKRS